jgi:hypothetical protein
MALCLRDLFVNTHDIFGHLLRKIHVIHDNMPYAGHAGVAVSVMRVAFAAAMRMVVIFTAVRVVMVIVIAPFAAAMRMVVVINVLMIVVVMVMVMLMVVMVVVMLMVVMVMLMIVVVMLMHLSAFFHAVHG